MSFFSHLECSVPCGAPALDPRQRHHLCSCGAPLLARYDLDKARTWRRESLECRLYGANVTLVDGLITDAGRMAAEQGAAHGWYDVSTLKEPYRIEGKKTMAYEIAEQMDWRWPDWIVYPTGGGTGMVGMWKAFAEIEQIGWVQAGKRPRMVSVQAEHC